MPLQVPDIATVASKWSQRAAGASKEYTDKVRTTPANQAEAAIAAAPAYVQGVQAAIARNGYEAGLRSSGDAGWRRATLEKGSQRYTPGVQVSAPKYQARTARSFEILRALVLEPRGAKNDPRNYARVTSVGNALHDGAMGKT